MTFRLDERFNFEVIGGYSLDSNGDMCDFWESVVCWVHLPNGKWRSIFDFNISMN